MQSGWSIAGPAAFFEFPATAAGARVIATDFRPAANDLPKVLLSTEVKIIDSQSARPARTPVYPVSMHLHKRQFDFVHPLLGIAGVLGGVDTLVGTQTQERRKPGRLADSQQTPCRVTELKAKKETLTPSSVARSSRPQCPDRRAT